MKRAKILGLSAVAMLALSATAQEANYRVVDTQQSKCFDNSSEIEAPTKGEPFYGQDAQHMGNTPSYTDNGDGTITDNVTGLTWQKGYEVMSYKEALKALKKFKLAGHNDWRLPSIKEAYSLILFSGTDVNPQLSSDRDNPGTPFIDTNFFDFKYAANGVRPIDSQMLSSTLYMGSTEREELIFGVNFADGRIKGYGMGLGGQDKEFVVRFVRGAEYGVNDFVDNGDATISDKATSLMWSSDDSGDGFNWEQALLFAEEMNKINYLGYSDWRIPNAKELQSIVDYSRSPLSTSSAAIDPLFNITKIIDESGAEDYPFFWSSTTHENSGTTQGGAGIYVAFGRSLGNMSAMQGMGQQGGQRGPGGQGGGSRPSGEQGGQQRQGGGQSRQSGGQQGGQARQGQSSEPRWVDVHGAGSQRSDPKDGDPSIYANGHGPQGDAVRTLNFARLVRDIESE